MRTVSLRQIDMAHATIPIGYEGENEFTQVRIDCKKTFQQYPDAVASLAVTDPSGRQYSVAVVKDGTVVVWNVIATDVASRGTGEIQINFLIDGTIVAKSAIAKTMIKRSIDPSGGGGGGTSNYNDLSNKPKINGYTLSGNVTLQNIGALSADALAEAIATALAQAKASGEFDGADGQDGADGVGIASIAKTGTSGLVDTYTITLTSGSTYTFTVTNGKDGVDGQDGAPGQDGQNGQNGFSPTVTVTTITGGHRVVITDATGAHTFDVMDGQGGGGGGAVIDDTAGHGDTSVVWSAGKTFDEVDSLKEALNIAEKGFALSVVRQTSDRGANWGNTRIPSFCYVGQVISIKNNGTTAINFNLKDANDTTVQTVMVPASTERTLAVNTIPDHINIYSDVYPIDVDVTANSFSESTRSELYAIKSCSETVFADPSEWVNGSFEGTNVPTFNERNTRLHLAQLLHVNVGDLLNIKVNGQKFGIGQWTHIDGVWNLIRNDNSFTTIDTQINIDTESYITVVVAKSDSNATITPSEITLTVAYVPVFKTFIKDIEQKVNDLAEGKKQFNFGAFSEGGHIVSHRGEPYPENTLYAFRQCIAEKSKILEMDLAFTSDNIPVLLHDTTINRTGRNADGTTISSTININSITYEQALQYDFGIYMGQQYAGIKIPKLQDVLIYLRQKNCCAILDLIGHTYTQAQYTILHDLLIATDMITFTALNAYQEQLDVYAELYDDTPFNPTSTTNSFSVTQNAYNKYKEKCPLIIVSGYASNASDTTFTYFSKANALGVVTLLGMIDTVESIQNLFNAGCRMVYSDNIRETQLD